MTSKVPKTLALDFDGVLCDGLLEYFQTSWRTYRQVWAPANPTPPEDLAPVFYRLRPVIETGWEMPILLRAILKGFSEVEILVGWSSICSQIVSAENLNPQDLATRVDSIRDQWIADDLNGWLKIHRFYPGVAGRLKGWIASGLEVFIVTTKEGRFVQQLLQQQGIQLPSEQIFGKECQQPKYKTLRSLTATPIWFVEDRLPALQAVASQADLEEVRLFLADWGYNTPAQQAVARQDRRIQLLPLSQFIQDFSAWPDPKSPEGHSLPD